MAERTIVERGENFRTYSDGTILLLDVIASYPHLDVAYAGKSDDGKPQTPKFGIRALMPKKTHNGAKEACRKAVAKLMSDNQIEMLGADKKFIRDGDQAGKPEEIGMWTVSAREERQPRVRNANKTPVTEPAKIKALIYGGCRVNVLIRPWPQKNGYGKRINAGLVAVQFFKDGKPFGEGNLGDEAIDDTFDSYEDDASGGFDDGLGGADLSGEEDPLAGL